MYIFSLVNGSKYYNLVCPDGEVLVHKGDMNDFHDFWFHGDKFVTLVTQDGCLRKYEYFFDPRNEELLRLD